MEFPISQTYKTYIVGLCLKTKNKHKTGMVAHTCHLGTEEVEEED